MDPTILSVKLEHGFKFAQISQGEGNKFFSTLEGLSEILTERKLFMDYYCLNSELKKYFFVENSFESSKTKGISPEITKFDGKLVRSYLDSTLRQMRLFKEGNINMPITYYFKKHPLSLYRSLHWPRFASIEPFSLNKQELEDLHNFLKRFKLPFSRTYIQLAFENFELSYETSNQSLAFLALINGLEALFNPGVGEISYRISRNCAVLLGSDVEDSRDIFKDVKYLYDLRCAIVHALKQVRIEKDKLIRLRDYVRRAITTIHDLDKPKDKALKILSEMGFGEFNTRGLAESC